jgi:hypothetical protein
MAVFSAFAALGDPSCAAIFNTDANAKKYSPQDVFSAVVFGGMTLQGMYFGSLDFAALPLGDLAVTQPDPATSVSLLPPTPYTTAKAASANIVLQNSKLSGGYYGDQTVQELALTLIHELGHVYNIDAGLGGSKILWDANPDGSINQAAEDANAKTLQACNPK